MQFIIRTPQNVVFDAEVLAVRVLTQTGHVGLRPRCEATVLAVDAGLVRLRVKSSQVNESFQYAGTAGGLLHTDGIRVTLLTPIAVIGDNVAEVQARLDQRLGAPSQELETRQLLGRLEGRILAELQDGGRPGGKP